MSQLAQKQALPLLRSDARGKLTTKRKIVWVSVSNSVGERKPYLPQFRK